VGVETGYSFKIRCFAEAVDGAGRRDDVGFCDGCFGTEFIESLNGGLFLAVLVGGVVDIEFEKGSNESIFWIQ